MVLIIGGAGYIGCHVNKLLHQRGYETLVLDNLVYGHKEFVKWGKFIEGDFGDQKVISQILKDYPIKAIMHFAAFAYVEESEMDPQKYYVNNVYKTILLLNAIITSGASEKVLVFSSTCAVYGIPQKLPVTEDHELAPINVYGNTKTMVEKIIQDYAKGYHLKYVILRYFNVAGASPHAEIGEKHDPETHLIPLVLDAAAGEKKTVQIFGTDYNTEDGTCIRDYIHVDDLARAHILCMEHTLQDKISRIYNLGNAKGYSVREVIEAVKRVTKKNFKIEEKNRRKGDPPVLVSSFDKIKKELGWVPEITDIDEIIQTAWNYHKKLCESGGCRVG